VLESLSLSHAEYLGGLSFGNEIDRYRNDRIAIDFVRDRGEEFVYIAPAAHLEDMFVLDYLIGMLEPELVPQTPGESVDMLATVLPKILALFASEHYACYRRAYLSFENCRNLWFVHPG
jgi:hypothetical protein